MTAARPTAAATHVTLAQISSSCSSTDPLGIRSTQRLVEGQPGPTARNPWWGKPPAIQDPQSRCPSTSLITFWECARFSGQAPDTRMLIGLAAAYQQASSAGPQVVERRIRLQRRAAGVGLGESCAGTAACVLMLWTFHALRRRVASPSLCQRRQFSYCSYFYISHRYESRFIC